MSILQREVSCGASSFLFRVKYMLLYETIIYIFERGMYHGKLRKANKRII